jgi:stage V sporulation protein R
MNPSEIRVGAVSRPRSPPPPGAPKPRRKPISEGSDWSFELIRELDHEIGLLAEEYGLDTYPNQIEVIRSDQMMDAYASVGMPISYHHWSYGKQFVTVESQYQHGLMGLAYEIVINSNPCIAYLMEENTFTMQALVIAHACYGHNSFFKGNYLFRTWTDATAIIDYLLFARNYIAECEERHGVREVESILDACHALMNFGVDRYKRPNPISADEERRRQQERSEWVQRNLNDLWRTLPESTHKKTVSDEPTFPSEPQENLLYFVEKNAPLLEPWQREIVRIVRRMAQYFYPQRQTQVMNEGWASFWHYTLMNRLYDEGLITEGSVMEFLASHTAVIFQPPFDHPGYRGINPYALGFAIFSDLRRMCEAPTDEDREWFPDIAGGNWLEVIHDAMRNFKDESFILQFLSPKVMRDLRLFGVMDDEADDAIEVAAIHDSAGYQRVRELLASQYNLGDREPNIQVTRVDLRGDRSLTLRHTQHQRRPLGPTTDEVLKHLHRLWGFPVRLEIMRDDEVVSRTACPPEPGSAEARAAHPTF